MFVEFCGRPLLHSLNSFSIVTVQISFYFGL